MGVSQRLVKKERPPDMVVSQRLCEKKKGEGERVGGLSVDGAQGLLGTRLWGPC